MKKKFRFTLCLTLIFATSNFLTLSATDNKDIRNTRVPTSEAQKEIDVIEAEFLQKNHVTSTDELTNEQVLQLVDLVNEFKLGIYGEERVSTITSKYLTFHSGDLYLTLDASTHIIGNVYWNHGHAGIGGELPGDVIEANLDDGVYYYTNRDGYWNSRTNGGIYKVVDAVDEEYQVALDYANEKVGLAYGFNPLSNSDFYCSELVFYAWDAAGYDLDHKRIPGKYILPQDLMLGADTKEYSSFN